MKTASELLRNPIPENICPHCGGRAIVVWVYERDENNEKTGYRVVHGIFCTECKKKITTDTEHLRHRDPRAKPKSGEAAHV